MRILSLSPVATEMVISLGAQHLLVGRTDECAYIEPASSIPSIGVFEEVTQEKVSIFEPDMVLFGSGQNLPLQQHFFRIDPQAIDDIYGNFIALGAILEKQVEADMIVHDLRKLLEELQAKSSGFQMVKVYCDTSVPLYVRELAAMAGAELYSSEHTLEAVTAFNPQMIISLCGKGDEANDESAYELLVSRAGWQDLQAIKHERVFILDRKSFNPTTRLADGAKVFAKLFHGVTLN